MNNAVTLTQFETMTDEELMNVAGGCSCCGGSKSSGLSFSDVLGIAGIALTIIFA